MEILAKLFGSASRVKILRLFLFNDDTAFEVSDVVSRAKVSTGEARKETQTLLKIGCIKKKSFTKDVYAKNGKLVTVKKKKVEGFELNHDFLYLIPLQNLLIHIAPLDNKQFAKRLASTGNLKLVVVSGVFLKQEESRIDLLIVGDKLKMNALESVVKTLEAEIGKELRFAALDTADFEYRLGVCDRLVRDVLDYPHQKIVDKLGVVSPKPVFELEN
ncbi:MAG: hypothetical protein WDZ88_03190 [Candidatus Paceibacterota bacterium]